MVRWTFVSSLYLMLVWLRVCLSAVNLRHQRPRRQTRTVLVGFVNAPVRNGAGLEKGVKGEITELEFEVLSILQSLADKSFHLPLCYVMWSQLSMMNSFIYMFIIVFMGFVLVIAKYIPIR